MDLTWVLMVRTTKETNSLNYCNVKFVKLLKNLSVIHIVANENKMKSTRMISSLYTYHENLNLQLPICFNPKPTFLVLIFNSSFYIHKNMNLKQFFSSLF